MKSLRNICFVAFALVVVANMQVLLRADPPGWTCNELLGAYHCAWQHQDNSATPCGSASDTSPGTQGYSCGHLCDDVGVDIFSCSVEEEAGHENHNAGNCRCNPSVNCGEWNNDQSQCEANGCYYWPESGECRSDPTPILINLKSNSAVDHLTSAAEGVVFDISGTGVLQQVAWTQPQSDVGFLVLDRNGNGLIDDGSELFGNATRKRDGLLAAHGFEALLDLDGGPTTSDGAITAGDEPYARLLVWLDRNHNGYSEQTELLTLSEAGIIAIYTDFTGDRREDRYGNLYALTGRALVHQGAAQQLRRIFDVVLTTR